MTLEDNCTKSHQRYSTSGILIQNIEFVLLSTVSKKAEHFVWKSESMSCEFTRGKCRSCGIQIIPGMTAFAQDHEDAQEKKTKKTKNDDTKEQSHFMDSMAVTHMAGSSRDDDRANLLASFCYTAD